MYCIYDLDGCLIDSSHRKATRPDGTLDLDHWKRNSTPEKVAADTLLPLVNLWRKHWRNGNEIVFCTARVMADADYEFLMENGLMSHYLLSRPEGCTLPDATLKEIRLRIFAEDLGMTWATFCSRAVMYDDSPSVISGLSLAGLKVEDAARLNEALAS